MIYDPPMAHKPTLRSIHGPKPIIYDSDGREIERYIGCDTCKHTSKNTACSYENSISRCLYGREISRLSGKPFHYGLPKYDDSYVYALWEPNWNDNDLPEDLFEI